MCVWNDIECALPLGCQSGRSVWRCCSQYKSTEKETEIHIRTSCSSAVSRLSSCDGQQLWQAAQTCPHMKITHISLDSASMKSLDRRMSLECRWGRSNTAVGRASFTLTSSYSLLLSACRIIDLEASTAMERIKSNSSNISESCVHYSHSWICRNGVHTFFQRGKWFVNSSVCLHTPQPWQSCCPGPAPSPPPPPHAADTWGSLPGWRSTVGPRRCSLAPFYWRSKTSEQKVSISRYIFFFKLIMA